MAENKKEQEAWYVAFAKKVVNGMAMLFKKMQGWKALIETGKWIMRVVQGKAGLWPPEKVRSALLDFALAVGCPPLWHLKHLKEIQGQGQGNGEQHPINRRPCAIAAN